MSNKYSIPEEALEKIRERDKECVYCRKKPMTNPNEGGWRGDWATIEHLNYLPPWNDPITVAICCGSCNFSRGNRKLSDWFKTSYCLGKNINEKTVAKPVREYIQNIKKLIN